MSAYLISRTTKGFKGAETRYLTRRGGWMDNFHLAQSFDSFLEAQVCLRGWVAEIVRKDFTRQSSVVSGPLDGRPA